MGPGGPVRTACLPGRPPASARTDAGEDVLRQLMALTFTRGNADCGAERDFLDRLPAGSSAHKFAQRRSLSKRG